MATNRTKPEHNVRFVCAECGERVHFVHEVRAHCVARMRLAGWSIKDGEAACPACVGDELLRALQQSVAANS